MAGHAAAGQCRRRQRPVEALGAAEDRRQRGRRHAPAGHAGRGRQRILALALEHPSSRAYQPRRGRRDAEPPRWRASHPRRPAAQPAGRLGVRQGVRRDARPLRRRPNAAPTSRRPAVATAAPSWRWRQPQPAPKFAAGGAAQRRDAAEDGDRRRAAAVFGLADPAQPARWCSGAGAGWRAVTAAMLLVSPFAPVAEQRGGPVPEPDPSRRARSLSTGARPRSCAHRRAAAPDRHPARIRGTDVWALARRARIRIPAKAHACAGSARARLRRDLGDRRGRQALVLGRHLAGGARHRSGASRNAIVLQARADRRSLSGPATSSARRHAGEPGTAVYSAHRDTHFPFLSVVACWRRHRRPRGATAPLYRYRVTSISRS